MALDRSNLPARLAERFILLDGSATLQQATDTLRERDGRDWWYLLVNIGERGKLLAVRFGNLIPRILNEGPTIFRRTLADFGPPLMPTTVVDASASRATIERLATANPNGLVVLADGGPAGDASHIVGVINIRETRFAADPSAPSITELAEESKGLHTSMTPSEGGAPSELEEAEPPAELPESEPEPQPATVVEGDLVAGDKRVEGDEVHGDKHVYLASSPEKTVSYPRRFEAAFPVECSLGREQRLWVAVMLPEADSPFTTEPVSVDAENVSVPMPVDAATEQLKPVDIEVCVTATGFRVEGENIKMLTVWPDGRTTKRWFQLEPEVAGEQEIRIELSVGGRLLDELSLKSRVFAPEERPARGLNLTFNVATFSLSLSLAAGG